MTGRRARALAWLGSCDRLLRVRVALDGGERFVAELAQDVVRAPAELARNREAGAVVIDPLGNLEVVGVVGRASAGGRQRRLEQRPAQQLRPLVREVAGRAFLVGLVDGDVETGVADGVVGACEAASIAELRQDRGRAHRPDPVQACDQGAAAGLAAGEGAELSVERRQFAIDRVDHPQRQRDELAPGRGELRPRERLPAGARARPQPGRHTLVEELRLQPLLPGGALLDQRLAHPHARAQLEQVRRWDPRLRQLARAQQPQLQITVGAVGLRPPLPPPLGRRLRRVAQMRAVAGTLDLLDDEPPAGRPLEREVHIGAAVEAPEPLPHRPARARADPASPYLTALQVDRLVRDLPAMNIKGAYDLHRDLLELHGLERPACSNTLVPRGSHYMSSLWSPVVATGGNRSQIRSTQKPQKQAKTVAGGW